MKKMTKSTALKEAKKRWGENGYIEGSKRVPQFDVGIFTPIAGTGCGHFEVKGSGETWEAAFQAANKQAEHKPGDPVAMILHTNPQSFETVLKRLQDKK